MTEPDVSLYYDELHRWTARDWGFQTYSGFENDTIHRFLVDEATGEFSPNTIYKFLDPLMPQRRPLRGLDAGCGYGGTCFHYQKTLGGHWTGITISQQQCEHATGIARARGLDGAIDFHVLSYDAPLPGRYDAIVAIESLIHSADPAATMRNLATTLDGGGRLLIADDMPTDRDSYPNADRDAALLEQFKRAWRCPVAPTAEQWTAHAEAAGLKPVARHDLSRLMRPRPEADLDAAYADLSAQRADKVGQGFGRLSDAEIGGLDLERLLGRGAIRYTLLGFEKS